MLAKKGYITLYTARAEQIKAINENRKDSILYEVSGYSDEDIKPKLYEWINENCFIRVENYPPADPRNVQDGIFLKSTGQKVATLII